MKIKVISLTMLFVLLGFSSSHSQDNGYHANGKFIELNGDGKLFAVEGVEELNDPSISKVSSMGSWQIFDAGSESNAKNFAAENRELFISPVFEEEGLRSMITSNRVIIGISFQGFKEVFDDVSKLVKIEKGIRILSSPVGTEWGSRAYFSELLPEVTINKPSYENPIVGIPSLMTEEDEQRIKNSTGKVKVMVEIDAHNGWEVLSKANDIYRSAEVVSVSPVFKFEGIVS